MRTTCLRKMRSGRRSSRRRAMLRWRRISGRCARSRSTLRARAVGKCTLCSALPARLISLSLFFVFGKGGTSPAAGSGETRGGRACGGASGDAAATQLNERRALCAGAAARAGCVEGAGGAARTARGDQSRPDGEWELSAAVARAWEVIALIVCVTLFSGDGGHSTGQCAFFFFFFFRFFFLVQFFLALFIPYYLFNVFSFLFFLGECARD